MRAFSILSSVVSVSFLALAALQGLGVIRLPIEAFMALVYFAGASAFAGALVGLINARREAK